MTTDTKWFTYALIVSLIQPYGKMMLACVGSFFMRRHLSHQVKSCFVSNHEKKKERKGATLSLQSRFYKKFKVSQRFCHDNEKVHVS